MWLKPSSSCFKLLQLFAFKNKVTCVQSKKFDVLKASTILSVDLKHSVLDRQNKPSSYKFMPSLYSL